VTNEELRQLCERLIRYPDPNQWHVERTSLAIEMVRLLAENEAMRGVVDAARLWLTGADEFSALLHSEGDEKWAMVRSKMFDGKANLIEALSQLEPPDAQS